MDPALWELFEGGSKDDEVSVLMRLEEGAAPPEGARIISRYGTIATARLPRGKILEVRNSKGVASLKAPRPVHLPGAPRGEADRALDGESESDEGESAHADADPWGAAELTSERPVPEDGTGVIVGICDWGIDFTHPNFRNPDGSTRLLALWDQRGEGDPRAPAPFTQGRLITREEINAALASPDPTATLGYHPADADTGRNGTHGTHVTDILAGNRREPNSRVGLASGADIVFVHLGSQKLRELENLGDSVGLLEGLDFVRRVAEGQILSHPERAYGNLGPRTGTLFTESNDERPVLPNPRLRCVLHLSAGKTAGPHLGNTLLERAVDAMLLEHPGLILVQSAGNYADAALHTHARIGPDQHHVLHWVIPPRDRTPNELEIWYSGQDVFDLLVVSPDGQEYALALGGRTHLHNDSGHIGNLYHRRNEPNSGLHNINVTLYPRAPGGEWRVVLHGREVVDGRIHAWIERDAGSRWQSRFPRWQATSRYTTNTICNCFRAVAVGAYDATQPSRAPTRFSSRGPTADGRQKPEIAAPGFRIQAARSLPRAGWQGEPRLCVKSGTSMAAPWVSGTVALMMQAAGRPLNVHEIRRLLIGSADPTPGPAGRSQSQLGYGYLNTKNAVEAARQLRGTALPPHEALPPPARLP